MDRLVAAQMLTTVGIVLLMLLLRSGLTRMILARAESGVLSEAQRRRVSHVRFATLVVENDFAVAERQRAACNHEARASVVAFKLQDQSARQIFDDLLLDGAQRSVGFDRHAKR